MDDRPRRPRGVGALAGAAAGGLVGVVDGVRAAVLFGTGFGAGLWTALLVAGADALLGLAAGGAVELVARVAAWGRGARTPLWARGLALGLGGVAPAVAAAAAVAATALRNNRFLAAGLTALAATAAAVAALVIAPALARLVARRRATVAPPWTPSPAGLLLGPVVIALFGALCFATVGALRRGLASAQLLRLELWVAIPAALLPAGLALVSSLRLPIRWRGAAVLAGTVYGGVAIAALARAWQDHLRFAPWRELIAGAVALAVGVLFVVRPPRRLPDAALRRAAVVCGVGLLAVVVLFRATASEPARKAARARAGFASVVLDGGQRLLDFDGDGFGRALGGGDCDDGDPDVHPGALDLPGDGTDADCDGEDATDALPPAARMAALPAGVPPELSLLLVTIDTLRADHLGCYGYGRPTSPVIDGLAAEGALFENGWAHAPSTRYSMPAIAAGRWPSAIVWDESIWWPRLGPAVRTTAQALHDRGYFTGGLFSFTYFAPADRRGFERGMDVYDATRAGLHVAVNGPMESRGSSSREVTDDAIAFVERARGQSRRFFLWVHYYDPHLSYEDHAEVRPFGTSRVDRYDGEIRFTDLHFGRLIAHLRAAGLWDRTAVILTGDHGEGFGEHGVTEHGFDLYAPQTKVPFIVRVPGIPGRRVRVPAGHVDIAPTLVNLARGPEEPAFIGRSLIADLTGPPAPDTDTRAVFQEVTSERGKKRALVTSTRHLLWNAAPADTTECYDLARDPAERRDVWGASPADPACVGLARGLRRLVAGLGLPRGAADTIARAVTPAGQPAPAPAHPLDAALGDLIGVRGYTVDRETARAGDTITASYDFVAKRRIDPSWRLFFHLEGPGGFRNVDHVPVDGLMPLERWRPGQRIRDRQAIAIPFGTPPGTYTLYLGAWRRSERLPVEPRALSDGKDRLKLFSVVVR